jgi:arylsulfatase A-like enzyme
MASGTWRWRDGLEWNGEVKHSAFEGGTRVPFILRWPGKIKPGVSAALVSQVDFLASFAALTAQKVPESAIDSQNIVPALLGEEAAGRTELVEQGDPIVLRQGNWKFIPASAGVARNKNTNSETGNAAGPQLYDLSRDLGERENLAKKLPERAQAMAAALEKARLGAEN